MGDSYLLPTLQNASKGPIKLTAKGEDFIDTYSRPKKDPTVVLKTAYSKALNFTLALGCLENIPYISKHVHPSWPSECLLVQEWNRSVATRPQECTLLGSQVSGGSGVQPEGQERSGGGFVVRPYFSESSYSDLSDALSGAASFLTLRGVLGSLLCQEQ